MGPIDKNRDNAALNLYNLNTLQKIRYRFDFEIGYLVKSPCRECHKGDRLPLCAEECTLLDQIKTVLADGVSCSRRTYE